MSHDVATNRLHLIGSIWASGRIWIRHDLIRHDDGNTELQSTRSDLDITGRKRCTDLVRQALECSQELGEMSLTSRELPTTTEVCAVESHARIHDEKTKTSYDVSHRTLSAW
jgi:hypothetical protein